MAQPIEIGVKLNASQAIQGLNGLGTKIGTLSGVASAAATAGINALATAMQTLVDVSQKAVQTFASFESTLSKVDAILEPTASEFKRLSDEAKRLGATTAFSASQAGEAFVELGKLGLNTNQILSSTSDILNLAASSNIDLSYAAKLSATTMKQFGLQAKDVNKIVDVIAKSAVSSALDVDGFGNAMKYVGVQANILEVSLEDTTAAISVLADNGIIGTMAGTSLRRIMQDMADTSSDLYKKLKDLGVEEGTLSDKFEALKDANLSAEESMKLFDTTASTTGITLIQNADKLDVLSEKFQNADGAANKMATTMLDNISGSATIAKSALESLSIAAVEPFSDDIQSSIGTFSTMVSDMGTKIGPVVTKFKEFIDNIKSLNFGSLGTLFSTIMSNVGTVVNVLSTTITPFLTIINTAAAGINTIIAGVKLGVINMAKFVTKAIDDLITQNKTAFIALLNPADFKKNVDEIRSEAQALRQKLTIEAEAASAEVSRILDQSVTPHTAAWEEHQRLLSEAQAREQEIRQQMAETYDMEENSWRVAADRIEATSNVFGRTTAFLDGLNETLEADSVAASASFQKSLNDSETAIEQTKTALSTMVDQISGIELTPLQELELAWREGGSAATTAATETVDAIETIAETINELSPWQQFWADFEQGFTEVLPKFNEIGSQVLSYTQTVFSGFKSMRSAQLQAQASIDDKNDELRKREIQNMKVSDKKKQKLLDEQQEDINKRKNDEFEKAKAGRIADVAMNTASAIMGAWSSVATIPYPGNLIAGGIMTGALTGFGIAQSSAIKKEQSPYFAQGGVVGGFGGGATTGRDNRTINAREGEMFLNARQQRNVFRALNSGAVGGKGEFNITQGDIIINGNATEETIDSIRQVNDELMYSIKDIVNSLYTAGELQFA